MPLETNPIAVFQGLGTRHYVICPRGVQLMHFGYYLGLHTNILFTLTYICGLVISHEFTVWMRTDLFVVKCSEFGNIFMLVS
jgi:hypothetical protein